MPFGQLLGTAGGWLVAAGLGWYIVRLVLKGKLVPRSQHEDVRADRDHWRSANDTQQQIALKQGMTLERLLSLAEISAHALSALQTGIQTPPRAEDR